VVRFSFKAKAEWDCKGQGRRAWLDLEWPAQVILGCQRQDWPALEYLVWPVQEIQGWVWPVQEIQEWAVRTNPAQAWQGPACLETEMASEMQTASEMQMVSATEWPTEECQIPVLLQSESCLRVQAHLLLA
jgi:hypothetical protein